MKRNKPLKATKGLTPKTTLKKTKSLPKKSKRTVSKLKDKLDKVFSLYVRLRDSDKDGIGECIDGCGRTMHYLKAHAGHFQSRRYLNTRWDEQNVNLQSAMCNNWGGGEQYKYGIAVDLKYGGDTAKYLHELAHSDEPIFPQSGKPYLDYLEEQIAYYTEQVQEQLDAKSN